MPLTENKPVLASCDEPVPGVREVEGGTYITGDDLWFGDHRNEGALVPVSGDTALARDYYIEQPEHQPGMALLLSLILCGTGQIYNGEVSKGIMMMVLCFLLWFVLLGWVVHIWSIVDAVVVAERLNRSTEAPT
jgi:TM2 domain-containing membrane protein YozV